MIYLNQIKLLPAALAEKLLTHARCAQRILNCAKKDFSLTICADQFIKKLNKQYRHKDKPTDVLSFPLEDKKLLGDIIISLPTASKNCKIFGTTLEEELTFLVVHGLCHLLGHDHHQPAAEHKMKKLEQKVLLKIFGRNYHA